MINGIAIKSKYIVIPGPLQKQILEQLHSNHIGIEETWLLIIESVYWINMNATLIKLSSSVPNALNISTYSHTSSTVL